MTARLTLISHAATEAQRRAAFPSDEAVEERELAKIAALGWNAPRVQKSLSGPELRTRQTADALDLSASIEAELRDYDCGAWRGLGFDELQVEDPEGIAAWLTNPSASPHGGESIEGLTGRVGRWLDDRHDAGHVIVVTHPTVIRAAIVYALNAPLQAFWRIDIAPLCLTDLRFNGRVWTLRSVACSLHNYQSPEAGENG